MRILMIEDMPVVASSTRYALMLLDGNIRFDIADSLAAALKKIERGERYDIALVDLSLPDASGSDGENTRRSVISRW